MNDNKLTDEEVWLRAYCAAIQRNDLNRSERCELANFTVSEFKKILRSGADNERTE